ncbi:hypothetical protein PENTCL1PPCAC_1621 [Pristionchus entomophagus]|uniref:Cytochrome P450 n=1 Tax=Pristionchus entomophagus TaxID=358040 RepID=A0AAV5SIH6_9BILA|nr:hypothetical protein PENTCL1PPCAC_1621 [Pristionchus entomophagus]
MSLTHLLLILGFILFIWKKWKERLPMIEAVDRIPGPFSIPLLGTTWQLKWRIEELVVQLRGWAIYYTDRGYGLIRIWLGTRPLVIAFRPEYAKEILESNTLISKGPEYGILAPWLGTGLLTSTHEKWRRRRKMITPAFHFNVLKQFLPVFNKQCKRLIGILSEQELEKDLDVGPFIKRCALDIICETAMGCSVNAQIDTSHPYVLSTSRLTQIVFLHQRMPWMWIDLIWKITGYDREYKENLKILHHFTLNVIRNRRSEYRENSEELTKREKKAFLDLLLEMEKDEHFTDEDIREEVDTFMFEGHDTTAASLGWTLWCISHYPDVQQKITEEIDTVFGNNKNRDVTSDDLVQLRYLEKVVKESLRLYPSVPNLTRYAEEDIILKDTKIPAGVTLLISPLIIHRNPEFYPDPETFNPDNFNEESISSRPSYTFIPFSAGPRNCIGQKFAVLEEKTLLAWFFRHFTVSSHIPFLSNLVKPEVISAPLLGFPMRVTQRQ